MSAQRAVPVEAKDALAAARQVLAAIWEARRLEGMLLPLRAEKQAVPEPMLVRSTTDLAWADPFAPVMPANAAIQAASVVSGETRKVGLFLRPCELDSLRTLCEHHELALDQTLLISVDCLGVLPLEDFRRHLTLTSDPTRVTREALRFAAQGGILPSRYQTGCQFCEEPYPEAAEVHFVLFGVPTERMLVLSVQDDALLKALDAALPTQPVPDEVLRRRAEVLKDLSTWRRRSYQSRQETLEGEATPEALLEHLLQCAPCRQRLTEQCPLFDAAWLEEDSRTAWEALSASLRSCAGCGTCEHECPEGYPLFSVILKLRESLRHTAKPA